MVLMNGTDTNCGAPSGASVSAGPDFASEPRPSMRASLLPTARLAIPAPRNRSASEAAGVAASCSATRTSSDLLNAAICSLSDSSAVKRSSNGSNTSRTADAMSCAVSAATGAGAGGAVSTVSVVSSFWSTGGCVSVALNSRPASAASLAFPSRSASMAVTRSSVSPAASRKAFLSCGIAISFTS